MFQRERGIGENVLKLSILTPRLKVSWRRSKKEEEDDGRHGRGCSSTEAQCCRHLLQEAGTGNDIKEQLMSSDWLLLKSQMFQIQVENSGKTNTFRPTNCGWTAPRHTRRRAGSRQSFSSSALEPGLYSHRWTHSWGYCEVKASGATFLILIW